MLPVAANDPALCASATVLAKKRHVEAKPQIRMVIAP
jgi:hypothetical protein